MKVAEYKEAIKSYFDTCQDYAKQTTPLTNFGAYRMLTKMIVSDNDIVDTDDIDEIILYFDKEESRWKK